MTRTALRLGLAAAFLSLAGLSSPADLSAQHRLADPFEAVVATPPSAPASEVARTLLASSRDAGFEESGFAQFMASPAGRIVRGVAGAAMIGGGIAMDDTGGTILAVAGAIPLSAGLFDLCYASALFGGPLHGDEIRAAGR